MITSKAKPALLQKSFDALIDPHSMETPTQKNDAPAFFAQAVRERFDMRRGGSPAAKWSLRDGAPVTFLGRLKEVDAMSVDHADARRELSPRNRAG